ncbi:Carbohydrate-binding protein [Phytophthora cinnamomi]|uniref:Carbohydrate-binding protein n=1 Tax=Phytophthora cinnamomi TaxID=4785 RepID=UPI003559D8A6|nr:Carbohydrate-binding protein [Phytophthora cinnamomi]
MFSSNKIVAMCIATVVLSSGVHAEREVAEAYGFGPDVNVGVPGIVDVGVGGGNGGDGRYVDVNVMGIKVRAPVRPRRTDAFPGAPPNAAYPAYAMPNAYAGAPPNVMPNAYAGAPGTVSAYGNAVGGPGAGGANVGAGQSGHRKLRSVE